MILKKQAVLYRKLGHKKSQDIHLGFFLLVAGTRLELVTFGL